MRHSGKALSRRSILAAASLLAAPAMIGTAHAQATTVRLSHGFGIHYLPLMVIRDRKLLEKHAERLGWASWMSHGGSLMAARQSMTR